ncbi:hypothetical protein M406DRAFT_357709 [Cryphonectria parasitica EP155]|uniref:Uncharacterized protein n=1 Tax=Cryphonectria parasitica (strain ATCC 38755 / EP155) TaxID=660469 RepID=A0A9P4XUX5_CRYP1|nr:uncharacterized protein M406DRAFT_357709 [Cryphonectria parasitica EP155]KAF3761371.1 hypothetical protein M406DRAFT_357709 [Cryphonectria parasitica EP155]
MCLQVNNLYACGHRCFKRFDNCAQFGQTCYGPGPDHKNEKVGDVCKDCKFRNSPNGAGRRKDPWGEGDPFRKPRKP